MSETVLTITVPFDLWRCSPNRRLNRWDRARETRSARERARVAWLLAGSPTLAPPVTVDVLARRGRQMDHLNLPGCLKALFDGLFISAITPDDRADFVRLGSVEQECGPEWRDRPEVVFTVRCKEE